MAVHTGASRTSARPDLGVDDRGDCRARARARPRRPRVARRPGRRAARRWSARAALGEPAAVLQLFSRHNARRRGDRQAAGRAASEACRDVAAATRRSPCSTSTGAAWKERALWWPEPHGAGRPGVDRHRAALRRRPRPGGRALPCAGCSPPTAAALVPARAPAGRPRAAGARRRGGGGAARRARPLPPRHPALFLRKAPGMMRSMHGRR